MAGFTIYSRHAVLEQYKRMFRTETAETRARFVDAMCEQWTRDAVDAPFMAKNIGQLSDALRGLAEALPLREEAKLWGCQGYDMRMEGKYSAAANLYFRAAHTVRNEPILTLQYNLEGVRALAEAAVLELDGSAVQKMECAWDQFFRAVSQSGMPRDQRKPLPEKPQSSRDVDESTSTLRRALVLASTWADRNDPEKYAALQLRMREFRRSTMSLCAGLMHNLRPGAKTAASNLDNRL
jgi:hypothetical protein